MFFLNTKKIILSVRNLRVRSLILASGIFFLLMGSSCVEVLNPYTQLPPGIWRGVLDISDEVDLPFIFDMSYDDRGKMSMTIHNADERISITDITFGRTDDLRDTLFINFALMDSHIEATYKENVIEGYWVRRNRENYRVPFVAYHGQSHRFSTDNDPPSSDLSGSWRARFEIETETEYPAVGEFQQKGNSLTGTFLTETGDYRYLEGIVLGDKVMMSCFDGAHAFLFTATITDENAILGKFYSGNHYQTAWAATRDSSATLKDPYDITHVLNPDKPLTFSLPNHQGEMISLNDSEYQDQPKLVAIMGTWCPNCLDEIRFILDYLNRHPDLDLGVIGIAFERYRDRDKALETIANYRSRLNIPFEILLGGYYDKTEATSQFGYLDKISSYPTLLFVDKNNVVTKIHTGFTGPATSKYSAFTREFEEEVNRLTGQTPVH